MTQTPRFRAPALRRPVLALPDPPAGVSPGQRRFNQLVARIDQQRRLLREWAEYLPRYRRRVQADFEPLEQRLRERRLAMVELLDHALDGKALGRSHRAQVQDMLLDQLRGLLADAETPELVRLRDKYRGPGLGGPTPPAPTPASAGLSKAQAKKAQAKADARAKAKDDAPAAAVEAAAADAGQALREVYRRLVSELHPDREPDAAEGTRKTALMQQVNRAYAAGDLLALLALQVATRQIDADALFRIAQDRLAHYNGLLEAQIQGLQQELQALTEPFAAMLGQPGRQGLTPAHVDRALANGLAQRQHLLHDLEQDLLRFQDVRQLKNSLR